jgi:hypothetical protein
MWRHAFAPATEIRAPNEKALLDSVQQRFWGPGTLCLDCLLVLHLQIRFAVHQNWNED